MDEQEIRQVLELIRDESWSGLRQVEVAAQRAPRVRLRHADGRTVRASARSVREALVRLGWTSAGDP